MNRNQLWNSILQQAISGKLVPQLDSEPEVEQVGPAPAQNEVPFELPPKWKWVQIGNVFSMQAGKFIKASNIQDDGLYPCYGANGIRGYVDTFNHEGTCNLIGRVGSCGSVHIATGKIYVTDNAVIATQCALVDADCAYYFLTSLNLKQHSTATAQPLLNKGTIAKVWYPLAPLSEQRRIVAMLEEIRPLVEKFGEAQEQLVKLETEFPSKLKASVLQQAIKGELVPQLDSEPEVEQIGPAPKPDEVPFELPPKWKWVQLEHLFSMQAGKFIKASLINDEGLYPCYGGNGLRGYVDNFNVSGTFNLIGRQGALCGNVHLVSGDFYATEHAVVAKHSEAIDPRCAYYFLTALNLNQYATATAQPGLAVSRIKKVFYPLAPLEEQRRIVAKLEEVFAGVEKLGSLMEYA